MSGFNGRMKQTITLTGNEAKDMLPAIHSYSISMRYQLKNTSAKVFEIILPTVNTGLERGTRARREVIYRGLATEEVAVETMKALECDKFEHAIGQAKNLLEAAESNPEQFFNQMNH